ncbi:MAG: amino acid permease, partial [Gammaproteobacteria bacterium]|nr:amino acid permease [Gammaproteobacteria bacterium]
MTEQAHLKRSLSLTLVTFYGIGTILGAGIYVLIGEVAATSGVFAPFSFLVASFLAMFTAFSYAELSSRFPQSAGEAIYIQEGLQRRTLSILTGLAVVVVGMISSATISKGFVGYLNIFMQMPDWIVITMLVFTLGIIAIWGISESVIIATILTLLEIGGLLLVLWVALPSFSTLPDRLPELVPSFEYSVWQGILLGGFLAFYAFIGFEDMVNVAEEVKQPSKTLPIAIVIALVITAILYF